MSRDPRVDPKPGDVLLSRDALGLWTIRVTALCDDGIEWEIEPVPPPARLPYVYHVSTIEEWRSDLADAEVVRATPESA